MSEEETGHIPGDPFTRAPGTPSVFEGMSDEKIRVLVLREAAVTGYGVPSDSEKLPSALDRLKRVGLPIPPR